MLFVFADGINYIKQRSFWGKLPVVNRDLRCFLGLPVWYFVSFFGSCFDCMGVCLNSFFFEVSNDSMGDSRKSEIQHWEKGYIRVLCWHNSKSKKKWRLLDFQECQKVHSFVFSFFQQCVDPTVVSFHCSQRSKMSVHRCNKPRHTCNGFQEEHPIQPVFLRQDIFLPREHFFVPTHVIETESQRLNEGISKFISNVCRV